MLAVLETVLLPNTGTDGPTAWISFGVAGNELPVPVCSWGCSLKTAVFFSPVIRSIASEHKLRVQARAAAIIRRSNEGVTAAAPGYSPMPTKADFSVAADARDGSRQIYHMSSCEN